MSKSNRIYALDVLRGITVAAMIVVNNAGGKLSYYPLQHSEWNGMTLCDMVFPSFLFIVGMSAYLSLSKCGFRWSRDLALKIVRRTVLILLIGWVLHAIEMVCKGHGLPLAQLRLTGVLPRIALCYFFVSVIALTFSRRAIIAITAVLLAAYTLLLLFGNGYANDYSNILSMIDRHFLGEGHLYTKRPIDPEGLAGTISSIAHTLIGFSLGAILKDKALDINARMLKIMVIGFGLLLCGWAVAAGMPFNKRIWSPSFVLASCGLVAMALSAVSYVSDIKRHRSWFSAFDVFGVNPLFLYVLSELVAIILSAFKLKPVIYEFIQGFVPDPYMASAVYSLLFVSVMWAAGYPLFKRKIYIKI